MSLFAAQDFIVKRSRAVLNERATAQEHFIDLCRLLGLPTPNKADPKGSGLAGPGAPPLDQAVLDAYGWPHDLTDEQILERLLALNLERAAAGGAAGAPVEEAKGDGADGDKA